ncbi:MAG TPA: hypothetical protein VF546_05130 [Pyrinomonadaceae bacterium]|jgi:hypothetical protein
MSKYLAFTEVVFKDRALLVSALESIGCTQIRQGENLAMGRYWAEQAETRADIIVPRGTVGNSFGDIGFMRVEGGAYAPVLDDLDKSRALGGKFLPRLRATYNELAVAQVAARVGGTMQRTVSGGVVKIRVRF